MSAQLFSAQSPSQPPTLAPDYSAEDVQAILTIVDAGVLL